MRKDALTTDSPGAFNPCFSPPGKRRRKRGMGAWSNVDVSMPLFKDVFGLDGVEDYLDRLLEVSRALWNMNIKLRKNAAILERAVYYSGEDPEAYAVVKRFLDMTREYSRMLRGFRETHEGLVEEIRDFLNRLASRVNKDSGFDYAYVEEPYYGYSEREAYAAAKDIEDALETSMYLMSNLDAHYGAFARMLRSIVLEYIGLLPEAERKQYENEYVELMGWWLDNHNYLLDAYAKLQELNDYFVSEVLPVIQEGKW